MNLKKNNVLLLVLISLSALMLVASFTTHNLMKKDVVDFVRNVTNIENIMMDKIMIDDSNLNQEQYNELIILENEVRNDHAVKQISEDVTPIIIHDLFFKQTKDIAFVKTDFEQVLTSYWEKFYDLIPDGQKKFFTKKAFLEPIQQWYIDSYYKQQVTRMNTLLPLPLKVLMFIIYITSQLWIRLLSLLVFIVFASLLFYYKRSLKQWTQNISYAFYGSSIFIVLCLLLCKSLYMILPYKVTQYIGGLQSSNVYIMVYFTIGYMIIGLLTTSISKKCSS